MTFRGFATLNHYVADVADAARWYAQIVGVQPYFLTPGPDGTPAYIEFRLGDSEDEFGFIDARFAPESPTGSPITSLIHWHVDDVAATLETLVAHGSTPWQPITEHAPGFATASVIDPFGCPLGIMYNQHYVDLAVGTDPA